MVHLKFLVAKTCQNVYSSRLLIILIPIVLSAFTHLWNLEGFPGIYRDEDHYLRKTMHVLRGLGPQEGPSELVSFPVHPYTHPVLWPTLSGRCFGYSWLPKFNPSNCGSVIHQRTLSCSKNINGNSCSC